jgi:hypothetical protein
MSLSASERVELERAVWHVRSGFNSFLASALLTGPDPSRDTTGNLRLRYDPGCMSVAAHAFAPAAEILRDAVDALKLTPIQWEPSLGVVIDNHRMLHGRGIPAVRDAGHRLLDRVLVR